MVAELIIRFDNPAELDAWMPIFRKYNLEDKILLKMKNIKKRKPETPKPEQEPSVRNWTLAGSVSLNGALDDIPNLRDYAYED